MSADLLEEKVRKLCIDQIQRHIFLCAVAFLGCLYMGKKENWPLSCL